MKSCINKFLVKSLCEEFFISDHFHQLPENLFEPVKPVRKSLLRDHLHPQAIAFESVLICSLYSESLKSDSPQATTVINRLVPSRYLFIHFRITIRESDQCVQSFLGRREKN